MKKITYSILCCCVLVSCKYNYQDNQEIDLKKIYELEIPINSKKLESASCCTDKFGNAHIVYSETGLYFRVDTLGKIIKKINIKGSDNNQFEYPNYIQFYKDQILISDLRKRVIKFLDYEMNYIMNYKLNMYPIKFKFIDDEIFYITDFLSEHPITGVRNYSFKLINHHVVTLMEYEVFEGYQLNVDSITEKLDLDNPGTIDFDFKNQKIYAFRQQADQYLINILNLKKSKKESNISINNWIPIKYNDQEKYDKMESYYKIISQQSNYPKENIKLDKKLAIYSIAIDKYGLLWACSPTSNSNNIKLNVFSDDGDLLKTMIIGDFSEIGISIYDNYILFYENDPTAKQKIALYTY